MADSTPDFVLYWVKSQRQVMSYIRGAVVNEHDAEDLYQEVVVAAARKFDHFDRDKPFTPWVLGIAQNQILNYFRTRRRERVRFSDTALEMVAQAHDQPNVYEQDRLVAMRSCLGRLRDHERRLLNLRYTDGLAVQSIAEEFKTSQNAVSVALYRIRRALLACIQRKIEAQNRP